MRPPPFTASLLPQRLGGGVRQGEGRGREVRSKASEAATALTSGGRATAPRAGKEGAAAAPTGRQGAPPGTRRGAPSQCLHATRCKIIPSAQKNTILWLSDSFPTKLGSPPHPTPRVELLF